MPEGFQADTNGQKMKWKKGIEASLRSMYSKKQQNQLAKNQLRNNVYASQPGLFSDRNSTYDYLESIKSRSSETTTSRISLLLQSNKNNTDEQRSSITETNSGRKRREKLLVSMVLSCNP